MCLEQLRFQCPVHAEMATIQVLLFLWLFGYGSAGSRCFARSSVKENLELTIVQNRVQELEEQLQSLIAEVQILKTNGTMMTVGTELEEVPLTCEGLPPPANGGVSIAAGSNSLSHGLGSVATYSCDPGYALVGEVTRKCEDINGGTVTKGVWSGAPPTCQRIFCPMLTAPINGQLATSQLLWVEAMANYSCDPGYVLVGDETRICEDINREITGVWSGSAPECEEIIRCDSLISPTNGGVSVSLGTHGVELGVGSVATYYCSAGYGLVGGATRTCLASNGGTWSGTDPVCEEVILCPALTTPSNGALTFTPGADNSNIGLGSMATYSCNIGYVLVGQSIRVCQSVSNEGAWSGNAPICEEAVYCPVLSIPDNGTLSISSGVNYLSVGSVATYSCDQGYVLVGGATRECEDLDSDSVGTWTGDMPECQVILCPELLAPENGDLSFTFGTIQLFGVGTEAVFSCNTGFILVGEVTRTCEENGDQVIGVWSGPTVTCAVPNNAMIDCQNVACRNELLVCPEQDNCTIDCYDSALYPCFQTSVFCPSGNGDCFINCDDSFACLQTNTTCPQSDCMVNCEHEGSCRNSALKCYGDSCLLNCDSSSACSDGRIDCLGGSCTVDCKQESACADFALSCSGESCLMDCPGYQSCQRSNIQCSSGNCTIYALNRESHLGSTIWCPSEGNCLVECAGRYSCRAAQFTCPTGGNCVFNFFGTNGDLAGNGMNVMCQENSICRITCSGGNIYCENSRITCPTESGDCSLECSGTWSCRYSTLTCGRTSNCLTCTGDYSCYGSDIYLPNPSHDIASLDCTRQRACMLSRIYCPDNNTCALSCSGNHACTSATINCPTNSDCSTNCTDENACEGATFNCPQNGNCSISCTDTNACQSATFMCSTNDDCAISCTGASTCQSATITCSPDHDCTITCDGQFSCNNAQVTCPTGDYSCNILCTDPLSCSNLSITNTHNVYLQCCGNLACSGVDIAPSSTECPNIS